MCSDGLVASSVDGDGCCSVSLLGLFVVVVALVVVAVFVPGSGLKLPEATTGHWSEWYNCVCRWALGVCLWLSVGDVVADDDGEIAGHRRQCSLPRFSEGDEQAT